MKLLVAVDVFSDPPVHGTAVIAHHWARRLRERGHRVDLLVVRQPRRPEWDGYLDRHEIGPAPIRVRRRPLLLRAWAPLLGVPQSLLHVDTPAIARQVRRGGYHGAVVVSQYLVGLAERLADGMPVVFAPVDSPALVLERRLGGWGTPWKRAWWRWEHRIWHRVEDRRFRALPAVVYVSPWDADHATRGWSERDRARVHVIPNGVDTRHFRPDDTVPAAPAELLFHGNLGSHESEEGTLWFMDHVLPRVIDRVPEASFRLVGRSPTARLVERVARDDRVRLHADVPDVRPHLDRAGVYVCPLLTGAGIKNRLLEALAMRRPIVSTSAFPRAMGLEHDTHLLLADRPAAFADAVVRLIRDRELAERLARAGRDVVMERFTWEAGVDRVEEMLWAG